MPQQKFIIRGGKPLAGTIQVRGAKNAALKIIAASLLSKEPWTIENLPHIEDISRILELARSLGVSIGDVNDRHVTLTASSISRTDFDPDIAKSIRASIVLTGPVLSRCGTVSFPHPGGCVIGERPIDVFLKGFAALGASIEQTRDGYTVRAKNGLSGAEIFFPVVSVTGTETLLMASVLAKGTTVLKNAAMEPEIVSLADFLNSCGAKIRGHGTPFITVEGVKDLGGGTCRIISDRLEAGTFALLAAATRSELVIEQCNPSHLDALWLLLQDAGVRVEKEVSRVHIDATKKISFKACSIKTHEYPGFITDLQAPAVVFLTQTEGRSQVHETIFEGRLAWVGDLVRMGAHIDIADLERIFIYGPTPLRGRAIESPDLRAGMAFVIAGLVAEGETEIHNVYQIDRGYEKIEERLWGIGADIERVTSNA